MITKVLPLYWMTIGALIAAFPYGYLSAQEVLKTSNVSPYEIYNTQPGPKTTEVAMKGYTDLPELKAWQKEAMPKLEAWISKMMPTAEAEMEGYTDTHPYHQIHYVSATTGSDAHGDGTRGRPWASIRHALDQIDDARLMNRQAILVAKGKYGRETLQMKEYVHLYGGFNPVSWDRDIRDHTSILDGQERRRIMNGADQSKVDGFVFQNGAVRGNGGAIQCNGTSPVISNNVFRKNRSLAPNGWDPVFIHEIANDGGAIAAMNGAAPRILNNLFVKNETEIGRGAGIAAHNRAAPLIAYNVFLHNVSGTKDPMKSSDGGAISSAWYSPSDIYFNVIIGNRTGGANDGNDGGGIFSELWSSVNIAGNLIINNGASDDGGGIYLSGQKHHYITEADPVLPEERYLTKMVGNVLVGNYNSSRGHDSGFRFTNNTRVIFDRNITYANFGGLDFRRSRVTGWDNIILDDVMVRDSDQAARFYNTLIMGELRDESETVLIAGKVINTPAEPGSDTFGNIFQEDGFTLDINNTLFEPDRHVSVLTVEGTRGYPESLSNRIIKLDGRWSTVESADAQTITIWGAFEDVGSVEILPTFSLKPQSEFYQKTVKPLRDGSG